MKNLSVFSLKFFFFIGASLKDAKKSVYFPISPILLVINLKKVFKKLLRLFNLANA